MDGFIQIHRKILEWEWYDDINTKVLFFHLLLTANYKENRWRGILIKPGQLVTGRNKLSEQTGLSVMQVRTSLDKLKSTGEVTIEVTSEYSILTLNNWDTYNQQSNQQITSNQPASNQRVTTTNKDNKDNKDNKEYKSIDLLSQEQIFTELTLFINTWNEKLGEERNITDTLKSKYKTMRKKYTIEQLRKSWKGYYLAKRDSKEYRISPIAFITQQNGIPNYL